MEFSQAFDPGRALGHGFSSLGKAPLSILLGGFLFLLIALFPDFGLDEQQMRALMEATSPPQAFAVLRDFLPGLLIGAVLGFISFLVRCYLMVGWIRVHRHVLAERSENVALLFSGADGFGRLVSWEVLRGFVGLGTLLVALLPGSALLIAGGTIGGGVVMKFLGLLLLLLLPIPVMVYVSLGLWFGDRAVVLDGCSPTEALERSWELARGKRLQLFLFVLVVELLGLAGLVACCIGVFVTRAVADVATTEAYLAWTRPRPASPALLPAPVEPSPVRAPSPPEEDVPSDGSGSPSEP